MKTANLIGAPLDYWVARAEGSTDAKIEDWGKLGAICISSHGAFEPVPFQPSTNWAQCGPLIDKHGMYLSDGSRNWESNVGSAGGLCSNGATPQEAICRAVVQHTFGDEVPSA